MANENSGRRRNIAASAFDSLVKQPRLVLFLLASWSGLAAVTQVFVNSPLFLDILDRRLEGAMGGLALSFQAVPLTVLYLYCARKPADFPHIFWLAMIHQGVLAAGVLYHLSIGTFGLASIIVPLVGAVFLGIVSFLQVFEPRSPASRPS